MTRPETPKAVDWYRLGNVILAQRRISIGPSLLSVQFMNLRCSLVRTIRGSSYCEEQPEAYPDSRFEAFDARWTPIVIVTVTVTVTVRYYFCFLEDVVGREEKKEALFEGGVRERYAKMGKRSMAQ